MSETPFRHSNGAPNGPPSVEGARVAQGGPAAVNGHGQNGQATNGQATNGQGTNGQATNVQGTNGHACTAAQLRRFIKSRPYVPMHELRRRFELNGDADEVSPIRTPDGTVYLGLHRRESQLIEELCMQGEIGFELCRDPHVPIVIGVYAMRPISRA